MHSTYPLASTQLNREAVAPLFLQQYRLVRQRPRLLHCQVGSPGSPLAAPEKRFSVLDLVIPVNHFFATRPLRSKYALDTLQLIFIITVYYIQICDMSMIFIERLLHSRK